MWQAIIAVIQIIYLLLKNKLEKDADEKKRKESMHDEAKDAIKSIVMDRDIKPAKSLSLNCSMARPLNFYPITNEEMYVNDRGDICQSPAFFNEVIGAKIDAKKFNR